MCWATTLFLEPLGPATISAYQRSLTRSSDIDDSFRSRGKPPWHCAPMPCCPEETFWAPLSRSHSARQPRCWPACFFVSCPRVPFVRCADDSTALTEGAAHTSYKGREERARR